MKRLFLYKLFQTSKKWFFVCVFFMIVYLFFFLKKMDTVFNPYNGMFAYNTKKQSITSTTAFKVNNKIVEYTKYLWWKKDFCENTETNYPKYIINNKTVLMDDYIIQKNISLKSKIFLKKRLTPDSSITKNWALWYCKFRGIDNNENAKLEFVRYDFDFNNAMKLIDSVSLFTLNAKYDIK